MLNTKPDAIHIRFGKFRYTMDVIDAVDMLGYLAITIDVRPEDGTAALQQHLHAER
jgi:hypothetical protein